MDRPNIGPARRSLLSCPLVGIHKGDVTFYKPLARVDMGGRYGYALLGRKSDRGEAGLPSVGVT